MNPKDDFSHLVSYIFRKENINKYTITCFIFVLWLCIMDGNNFYQQYKLKRTLYELEQGKIELQDKLEDAIQAKNDLENNIEKYARERFFMHQADEEIIIIERDQS